MDLNAAPALDHGHDQRHDQRRDQRHVREGGDERRCLTGGSPGGAEPLSALALMREESDERCSSTSSVLSAPPEMAAMRCARASRGTAAPDNQE